MSFIDKVWAFKEVLTSAKMTDMESRIKAGFLDVDALRLRRIPGQASVVTKYEGYGHSIAFGQGAANPATAAPVAKLAKQIGATPVNRAVSGSTLCNFNPDPAAGGWGAIFNLIPRTDPAVVANPAIINSGINDIGVFSAAVVAATGAFAHTFRAVISRILSAPGSWKNADDASISFGSGWATQGSTANTANYSVRYCAATTATFYAITTPASFKGGVLAIFELIQGLNASGWGGNHTFKVDGTAISNPTITDTRGIAIEGSKATNTPIVQRIKVPAGAHTITCELAAGGSGYHALLGYAVEQKPDVPVIVENQYLLNSYAGWSTQPATFPFTPSDASVSTMNATMASIVSEFGPNVQIADNTGFSKRDDLLATDLTHPNDDLYRMKSAVALHAQSRNPALAPDIIAA